MADSKKPSAKTLQIASFANCINRLRGNFPPIEEARLEGVLENFERLFRQVGWDRFAAGVDSCVFDGELMFFPSVSEFKKFLPDPPAKEQAEINRADWERDMRAKKAAHPEQFYGIGDLYVIMRVTAELHGGEKKYTRKQRDEIIDAAIAEARTKYGYHLPIPEKVEKGFDHFED